ncbi:uncharacterized protein FA14DRAFT_161801, partial [Meira miltonrushii]
MINLWAPSFGDVYLQPPIDYTVPDNYHPTHPISAEGWAATQWYSSVAGLLIVPTIIPLLAFYEHTIHITTESVIWWRLCHRKRTKRGVMPLAILWLRYWTLMLGILLAVTMWSPNQTLQRCSTKIWPLTFAISTLVSISTACVNAWRSRTITRAAIQSTRYYSLLQIVCAFFVLARLAALVTAFVFQHFSFSYLSLVRRSDKPMLEATCLSFSLALSQKMKLAPELRQEYNYLAPIYTIFALLVTLTVSDLVLAMATLSSILKLKRNISTESNLISSLFNSSIMYYTILIVLDLAGLAYFVATSDSKIVFLLITIGSILTVRVLINEQDCILAASRNARSYWTKGMTENPPIAGAERSAWTQNPAHMGAFERHFVAPGLRARMAQMDEKDAGGGALALSPTPFNEVGNVGMQRRGAGMTDIERVTVLEAGRSIDRPWPVWEDDDTEEDDRPGITSADRARSAFWQRKRIEGERNGIQTLIREWWRDVEDANPLSQPSYNLRTHDGTLDIRSNAFSKKPFQAEAAKPSAAPQSTPSLKPVAAEESTGESSEEDEIANEGDHRMSTSHSLTSLDRPAKSKRQRRRAASLD